MNFTKVEMPRRAMEVVAQLISAIRIGDYNVGDRLPPEREMAATIGVSRASVREGLALLHLEGIIERRRGSGTFVKSNAAEALARTAAMLDCAEQPHEVFEWQRVVEPAVTLISLQTITEQDLEHLSEVLGDMRICLQRRDRKNYSRNDRRYHLIIANATRNSLAMRQMKQLYIMMGHEMWRGMKDYGIDPTGEAEYLQESLSFHEQLHAAISDRNADEVIRLYRARYQRIQDIVFDGESDET